VSTPHDKQFQLAFGQPENAAELLRRVVPPVIGTAIDWRSLARCNVSFVDSSHQEHEADVLFTADLAGQPAFLYLLLEHKSTDQPLTALQLLRYVIRIWERHLQDHPSARRLPPILPFVLHHGDRPWSSARSLRELIDLDGLPEPIATAVLQVQPDLQFILDDLATASEGELLGRVSSAFGRLTLVCFQLLRGATPEQALAGLHRWLGLLRTLHDAGDGQEAFLGIVSYIVAVADLDREQLRSVFAKISSQAENTLMSKAGRIVRDALQEGIEQGIEQGRANLLLRQLRTRFVDLSADVETRVRGATPAELDRWADRILFAATLDEVFATT